jgi:hypothetical protein
MKHLKTLGLAAIAAAALMASLGTGTASATVLCSTTAEPCPAGQAWPAGTALDLSLEAGSSLLWQDTSGNTLETCINVTLTSEITGAGSGTSTVKAKNKSLTWNECTWADKTIVLGGLELHKISGTSNGTLTASEEISWTFNDTWAGSCIYGWTSGNHIGTLTEGKPATLDLNSVIQRLSGSSFLCASTAHLIGSFTVTAPGNTTLAVEAS